MHGSGHARTGIPDNPPRGRGQTASDQERRQLNKVSANDIAFGPSVSFPWATTPGPIVLIGRRHSPQCGRRKARLSSPLW